MQMSEEDVEMFYELYNPLLVYTNKKFGVVRGLNSPEDLKKFTFEKINKIRERLYEGPELMDSFVRENPLSLPSDKLELVSSWKNFVKGKFFIFRYLKNYTVFLDPGKPPKAYGVFALNTTFEEMLGPYLPIMVEAVLLPFHGKITYDGVVASYRVTFGGGIRRDLNDLYQEAKTRFGIITSLPFSPPKDDSAARLRFYLRNEDNRARYCEEIDELISSDPELLTLYYQELGRINARRYGKRLREIGLAKGWFAVFEDTIIASGATKDEVERALQRILPAEKRKFVYIFRLK